MIAPVRVVTAAEAARRDDAAVGAGIPSRALMARAGAAAATEIARRYPDRLARGAVVFTGPGNNGGDGWVVARALAAVGVRVRVVEAAEAKTPDARAERELALPSVDTGEDDAGGAGVVVDAVLGTGASGAPRGGAVDAIERLRRLRARGETVVAIDVPSGVDATTGDAAGAGAVVADLTLTFGTLKRGLLVARGHAGRIAVLDIGLGPHADLDDGAPVLADARWVRARLPAVPADAHKGTRRRIVIVGGAEGMAGAAVLAAKAAFAAGVGMVRLLVAPRSLRVVQTASYEATARPWPESADDIRAAIGDWAHAVLLGPGLGATPRTRALVEGVLGAWKGPVVLDADALNVFAGEEAALSRLLRGRPALLTPHVNEFARLAGLDPREVPEARFEIGADLARAAHAVILLKGVPTVISSPTGARVVSAAGTPALAAAGSGDLLSGIAATLLAQMEDAADAAASAAWAHGRAAELARDGRSSRGVTLGDVMAQLSRVWDRRLDERTTYPVLAELPAVGDPPTDEA